MTDAPTTSSDTQQSDRIVLTLPGSSELRGVASLVLGGIGSRLDLPYEKVDELQLAVLTLLGASDIESATIEVEIANSGVIVDVGPLPEGTSASLGLRTVLERLVDSVASTQRDSAEWVTLRIARPRAT